MIIIDNDQWSVFVDYLVFSRPLVPVASFLAEFLIFPRQGDHSDDSDPDDDSDDHCDQSDDDSDDHDDVMIWQRRWQQKLWQLWEAATFE